MAQIVNGVVILSNDAKWIESSNRWQINVQHDGKRKTFTSSVKGRKGRKLAEEKAKKWILQGESHDNVRFGKLYLEYLEEVKLLTGSQNYIKHEQIGRIHLSPLLKHKRVLTITDQDWQDCINEAYKKGLAKKTLKNIRASITGFCKYARKQRIKIEKPEFIQIPSDAPVGERTILQPDELKLLFSHDKITDHKKLKPFRNIHACRFIVLTGLRRGEACYGQNSHIKDDIYYMMGSVNSLNEITKGKTDNAKRWFMLTKMMKKVLNDQEEMLKKEGIISPFIFPDEDGKMLDPKKLYNSWCTYRRQHGIKSSLHEMRHTFISIAKADVPEALLQPVVGHSEDMDTFGVYGHEVDGDTKQVAEIMDGVWDKILG